MSWAIMRIEGLIRPDSRPGEDGSTALIPDLWYFMKMKGLRGRTAE
jgi:hypothetical protein